MLGDPYGRTAAVAKLAQQAAPCYMIIGKPGVGKTTLARALAQQRNSVHLSVERAVALSLRAAAAAAAAAAGLPKESSEAELEAADELEDTEDGDDAAEQKETENDPDALFVPAPASALAQQAYALATKGEAVSTDMGLALLDEILQLEAVRFHGYVLEGLPCEGASSAAVSDQLARIAAWQQPPTVAIFLQASDHDILARWQGALVDPNTGATYLTTDLQPEVEALTCPSRQPVDSEQEDAEDAEDEDNDAEDAGSSPPLPHLAAAVPVPAAVAARLVLQPQQAHARLAERLAAYKAAACQEQTHFTAAFPALQRLVLNATRSRQAVANDAVEYVHVTNLAAATQPVILDPLETLEFDSDAALRESLQRANLDDDDEPAWHTSAFNVYCPVTLVDQGILLRGSAEFALTYQGAFFVCSSAQAQQAFRHNPSKYLCASPSAPGRLFVMGPASAKVSQSLSERTGALLLDSHRLARSLLAEQQQEQQQEQEKERKEEQEKQDKQEDEQEQVKGQAEAPQPAAEAIISFRLGSETEPGMAKGPALPTEIYLEAIARAVASTGRSDWVLSGFPRTAAEFGQLIARGVVPGAAVLVQQPAPSPPLPDLAAIAQSARERNLSVIDVLLPSTEEATDRLHFSIAQGVQKIVDTVQQPLRAPAQESTHDFDEEDSEVDPNFGVTKHYCPVALVRDNILRPGIPDLAVTHNGAFYHLSSAASRAEFVAAPHSFVTEDKPPSLPPLRLVIMGPTGAGKLTQGRRLAKQHGLLCVSFAELLEQTARSPEHPHCEEAKGPGPVSPETAMELLRPLWSREPYRSTGLVLTGFPRDEADAKVMTETGGLFPDAVLHLEASESAVTRRLLPLQLAAFARQRQAALDVRQQRLQEKQAAAAARRAAWEESQAAAQQEVAQEYLEEEDLSEEMNADEAENEPLQETRERLSGEIADLYNQETERDQALCDLWQDSLLVPVVQVNASLGLPRLTAMVDSKLSKYTTARPSLLCSARSLTPRAAAALLARGLKFSSGFGLWCPVDLLEKRAVFPLRQPRFAAVHRHHVYYFASRDNQQRFVEDPLRFVQQPLPPPPVVPVSLAVVGPPCSGKTTLCKALSAKYGCMHVTMAAALDYVLLEQKSTALAQQLQQELGSGQAASPALVVQALSTLLLSPQCQTFGYVLDGFPCVEAHAASSLVPRKIIELMLPDLDMAQARRGPDQAETGLMRQFAAISEQLAPLRHHYTSTHRNWHQLPAHGKSRWWLAAAAAHLVEENVRHVQTYVSCIKGRRPAPVFDLPLTPAELAGRLSPCGQHCPVSLLDRGELVTTPLVQLEHTLEYNQQYFKLGSAADVVAFMACPERYSAARLPDQLPLALTSSQVRAAFPRTAGFQGLCPVTYVEGGACYDSLVPGSPDCAAGYGGEIFLLASEAERALFLRRPQQYANVPLPSKRPPRKLPLATAQLPNLGFLEQTCADVVTKALQAVGLARPKYPFLSPSQSALLYMSIYLRAENPRSVPSRRQRFQKKLRRFREKCELLKFLTANIKELHDDPRPIDFDYKMTSFLAMAPHGAPV